VLAAAPNTKLAQKMTTQVTSKSMDEPSIVVLSANSDELAQEDIGDKSVSMTTTRESPKTFAFQDPQEDFVKKSLTCALGVGPTDDPSSQEDLSTTSDMAFASSKSPVASKSVEEPLSLVLSADFEGPIQVDVANKTSTTMATIKLSLVSSLEESKKGFEKDFMASTPSGKSAQKHSDIAIASSKTEGASKFIEEALVATPSANFGKCEHKIDTNESDTIIASVSSFDDLQEDFEKEFLAVASSVGLIHKPSSQEYLGATNNKALASLEPQVASKFIEEPLSIILSANFDEPACEDEVDKSDTVIADVKLPLASLY